MNQIIIAEYKKGYAEYFCRYRCNSEVYIKVNEDLLNETYKVYNMMRNCSFDRVKDIMDKNEQCIILVPMDGELLKELANADYLVWAHFPAELGTEKAAKMLVDFGISKYDRVIMLNTTVSLADYINTIIDNHIATMKLIEYEETGKKEEG